MWNIISQMQSMLFLISYSSWSYDEYTKLPQTDKGW